MIKYEFYGVFREIRQDDICKFKTTFSYHKDGLMAYEAWGDFFIYHSRGREEQYVYRGVYRGEQYVYLGRAHALETFLLEASRELPENQYKLLFERYGDD